ncbi:fimbrial protein [Bordetella trematum]|uniref:fimbrial protein n=1 Tax=Bordetella trematum TaxID=123899 RepID=UPI000D83AFE1|nr:fimbrial protein [Bordetella trematum]SPU49139.1 fimbrial subunit [Bordetella trematum]VDH04100.1 fimbrial protein [Bordetella trematum]
MAPSLRTARLGLLTLLLSSVPVAHAVDGTITINGEITDSTCKINGQTPPADVIVNLPKISTSALKNTGDSAGATAFTLKLTDCPVTLTGEVKAYFEPGITTDYDSGALYAYTPIAVDTSASAPLTGIPSRTGATKANNVEIQLANTDGKPIKIGAPTNMATGVVFSSSGSGDAARNTATLHYLARYYKSASGDISPGKLVTYVAYSIAYP